MLNTRTIAETFKSLIDRNDIQQCEYDKSRKNHKVRSKEIQNKENKHE